MFNDLENGIDQAQGLTSSAAGGANKQANSSLSEPVDIFASAEDPEKPDVFRAIDSASVKKDAGGEGRIGGAKKALVAVSLLVTVALFFGGLWYGYTALFKKEGGDAAAVQPQNIIPAQKEIQAQDSASSPAENSIPDSGVGGIPAENTGQANPALSEGFATQASSTPSDNPEHGSATSTATEADSDFDGLTDDEEAAAGTDPAKKDTDFDGLLDYEEINKYGTDPLSNDTDGDTYMDGQEVQGGYNPKGEGKLEVSAMSNVSEEAGASDR
jgi:hypothetical protein